MPRPTLSNPNLPPFQQASFCLQPTWTATQNSPDVPKPFAHPRRRNKIQHGDREMEFNEDNDDINIIQIVTSKPIWDQNTAIIPGMKKQPTYRDFCSCEKERDLWLSWSCPETSANCLAKKLCTSCGEKTESTASWGVYETQVTQTSNSHWTC